MRLVVDTFQLTDALGAGDSMVLQVLLQHHGNLDAQASGKVRYRGCLFSRKSNLHSFSQTINSMQAGETRSTFYKHLCLVKCVTLDSLMFPKSLSTGSLLVLINHFFL